MQGPHQHSVVTWSEQLPERERVSRGKACLCTYDWFVLLYSRNQHNSLKEYPPIKKKKS